MFLTLIVKGLFLGLMIAAPVGPIGVLCIRRSLNNGRTAGFVTGLGAASADAVYGCVAAFGFTAISGFLVGHRHWVGLVGGAILGIIGMGIFLRKPLPESPHESRLGSNFEAWGSTFLLTLANPATILSFAAMFGAYARGVTGYGQATVFVLGVFLGSAAWWYCLSSVVSGIRAYIVAPKMVLINRVSGVLLLASGILAIARS
jgi:threonine/homoserine/homoserine lactone efflux protein